jgi:hypothetical protein
MRCQEMKNGQFAVREMSVWKPDSLAGWAQKQITAELQLPK